MIWENTVIIGPITLVLLNPFKIHYRGDFPGSPVVKTLPSKARGAGSIPRQGAKIPHASRPKKQNIKQKQDRSKFNKDLKKKIHYRASLVAQWLRIRLPMQGTRVRALVQEDPACHGATKPAGHNY